MSLGVYKMSAALVYLVKLYSIGNHGNLEFASTDYTPFHKTNTQSDAG